MTLCATAAEARTPRVCAPWQEKPADHTERGAPLAAPRRSLCEDPVQPERKKNQTKQTHRSSTAKKKEKKNHIIVYDQAIKELGEGHYRSDIFCSRR